MVKLQKVDDSWPVAVLQTKFRPPPSQKNKLD